MLVMYIKRTLHVFSTQMNYVLSNSKITGDYELILHERPKVNEPSDYGYSQFYLGYLYSIMDIHISFMDIENSIME